LNLEAGGWIVLIFLLKRSCSSAQSLASIVHMIIFVRKAISIFEGSRTFFKECHSRASGNPGVL